MSASRSKDGRKRKRIAFEVSDEQHGQIKAKAGAKPLSEFARERVLLSDNFHDPQFEVSAKLSDIAARVRRFGEWIDRWDSARLHVLIESGKTGQVSVESEFQDLIYECLDLVRHVSAEAREVSRIVATRNSALRVIRPVRKGQPKP